MIRRATTLAVGLALAAPPFTRLGAQSITVVANRTLRSTAVLQPHLQYWLALDSADGALVMRDVAINPVTIGTIRVEGIEPLARQGEARPVPDTVRFEPDGRVALTLSNGPARPMITAELVGSRLAPAFRLSLAAEAWPIHRVMLVTISPADLREVYWRSVGWGERDRVRIDDAALVAFLADSAAGPTTVAIAFGRGVRGRLQGEATDVMVSRDVGAGQSVVERRRVAALSLIVEPIEGAGGSARADLLVGLGNSESEALQNARSVALETPGSWRRTSPRVVTPSADVSLLLTHILGASGPMLEHDRITGLRYMPAAASGPVAVSARDGWYGALVALQLGAADAVCSEYQVLKRAADGSGAQRALVANRLSPRGKVLWAELRDAGALGDKEPYVLMRAAACYRVTRDATWLAAELPTLRRIAGFIIASDADTDGLVESASSGTRSGMGPLTADSVYRVEDPVVNAIAAYALDRLAELEDAAARRPGGTSPGGDALRGAAERIRAALPGLWRPANRWFAYHAMPDGGRSWDHDHLQGVDVLLYEGVADSAMRTTMLERLGQPGWYDAAVRAFNTVSPDETWYDAGSAWRGAAWHVTDFKALQAMFTYGTAAQREVAWSRLESEAGRIVRANYGRPGGRAAENGLSMAAAGALFDLLARGLFGVEDRLDEITIAPHVDGIADNHTWRLDNWVVGRDTVNITYRPADRMLNFRLGAPQRRRVVMRLPWLRPGACVTVRRGGDTERLTPVYQRDGGAYVDLRAAFEPAEVTVAAPGCAP